MRPPECVLVRLGEIALKSPQVQRRMFGILLDNMKAALAGTEYVMETNPNRIFIYTKQIDEAIARTKKVFGVTSVSPCWTCFSALNDIRMLASDIASDVLKISEKDSFAIRARRVGRHRFSSKEVAEEAGAAVKRVTGANVELSNPDKQIFIETRSRKTYAFVEKIPAAGGMPVGVSGGIISVIENPSDAAAAWLMMKRGCEAVVLVSEENIRLAEKLKEWDAQMSVLTYEKEILENFLADIPDAKKPAAKKMLLAKLASLVAEKEGALGISSGIREAGTDIIRNMNESSGVPVYLPLMLYPEKELKAIAKLIGIKIGRAEEKYDYEKSGAKDMTEAAERMLESVKNKGGEEI
ncbi:MAG: hypothetical protein KKB25_01110 [Nanoarchaeota archaeon]|nr:hypothetical protein [Nanoarchaeota archaeon]